MKKRLTKAQSSLSPITHNSKKKIIKGLGLFFFLVGAVLIISSFFNIPLPFTGNVIAEGFLSTISLAGLLLEIIGITLMVIKIKENPLKKNHQSLKNN